jgi:hypothetical protein
MISERQVVEGVKLVQERVMALAGLEEFLVAEHGDAAPRDMLTDHSSASWAAQ